MSKQELRWALVVCVFTLLALGLAGSEDYRVAKAMETTEVVKVVQR